MVNVPENQGVQKDFHPTHLFFTPLQLPAGLGLADPLRARFIYSKRRTHAARHENPLNGKDLSVASTWPHRTARGASVGGAVTTFCQKDAH
jgi:hypothetical protein